MLTVFPSPYTLLLLQILLKYKLLDFTPRSYWLHEDQNLKENLLYVSRSQTNLKNQNKFEYVWYLTQP